MAAGCSNCEWKQGNVCDDANRPTHIQSQQWNVEYFLNRNQARRIDADAISQLGISGLVLMENAARGVCDFLLSMQPVVRRPAIVCGHGNNGGDGLALARQLDAVNRTCDVYLLNTGKSMAADAVANLRILECAGIKVIEIADSAALERAMAERPAADIIVDCLLGTGVHGTVREPFRAVIQFINCYGPVFGRSFGLFPAELLSLRQAVVTPSIWSPHTPPLVPRTPLLRSRYRNPPVPRP